MTSIQVSVGLHCTFALIILGIWFLCAHGAPGVLGVCYIMVTVVYLVLVHLVSVDGFWCIGDRSACTSYLWCPWCHWCFYMVLW